MSDSADCILQIQLSSGWPQWWAVAGKSGVNGREPPTRAPVAGAFVTIHEALAQNTALHTLWLWQQLGRVEGYQQRGITVVSF